jgi:hypothetical protein
MDRSLYTHRFSWLWLAITSVLILRAAQESVAAQDARPAPSAGTPVLSLNSSPLPPFASWLSAGTQGKGTLRKVRPSKSYLCEDYIIICDDGSAYTCCDSYRWCVDACQRICGAVYCE